VLSSTPSTIADRFVDTVPLAVGLAVVLLVWAWAHTPNVHRARMVALASFGFAAVVSAFPQPGPQHLTEIVPLLFTVSTGALAISRFGTPRGAGPTRIAVLVLVAWTAIGGVALVARAVLPAQGLGFGNSILAHFEDTPRAPTDVRLRDSLARLHRLTGGDVFIVRSDASYLYLGGGLRNPTRYDFPVRSDLGSSGQAGVVRDITRGSLRWVCLGHHARHRYD